MNISQTIQETRKARGLTLSALAGAAGIHKSTLSRWERGISLPFTTELTKVLDVLQVSDSERRRCFQSLNAPRAVQLTSPQSGAGTAPVATWEILRALRLRAGLTQGDAARAVGVSQGLVTKWEKGECRPSDTQIHRLCHAFRSTPEESVFLTSRAWQEIDPLPQDKDALDAAVLYLEHHDPSPYRAGQYLALAARYQSLFQMGKISEIEAIDVYGNYGYYLSWRFDRQHTGRDIVAPVLKGISRSRGPLTWGQIESVTAHVDYCFVENRGQEARDLLLGVADRIPHGSRDWWLDYMALAAECLGEIDVASRLYRDCLRFVASARNDSLRRGRYVNFLIRQERYREALTVLTPPPSGETRHSLLADYLIYSADIYAGLGDRRDALNCLYKVDAYMRPHNFGVRSAYIQKRIYELEN